MNSTPPEVLIVSPIAPPIGGNSVHAKRLMMHLQTQGYAVQALDYQAKEPKGASVVTLAGSPRQKQQALAELAHSLSAETVVHYHISALGKFKYAAPPLMHVFRKQRQVITIHSGSFVKLVDRPLMRSYARWLFGRFDHIIAVSQVQADFLIRLGIPSARIDVIPAFIAEPLTPSAAPCLLSDIPTDKCVIVTSGSLIELYDFEPLIDCIERLPKEKFHFVFAFYNQRDEAYASKIDQRLQALSNVTVANDLSSSAFLHVMAAGDVYVRTTLTDGDAVAVREALAYGLAVLATDCVTRPSECQLFPTGDSDALYQLLLNLDIPPRGTVDVAQTTAANLSNIEQVYKQVRAIS